MPPAINIDEIIHSRRRTIALVIRPDGTLLVRAPLRMPAWRIRDFVVKHDAWIRRKRAQMQANPLPAAKKYLSGESFLYLGKTYPLVLVPHQRPALVLTAGRFQLVESSSKEGKDHFVRWYRQRARQVLTERVRLLSAAHGLSSGKIRISSARTRWGSYSTRGTLSFTWRLVLAPPEVVDYVVIHELVHSLVRNHSPKFWQRVEKVLPGYKKQVAWLRKNGRFLTLD